MPGQEVPVPKNIPIILKNRIMKKQEMVEYLNKQMDDLQKEIAQLQDAFAAKKETMIRITGALEALAALEPDEPEQSVVDHSDAAAALGILK